jgi:excisionase family DNA binding protein
VTNRIGFAPEFLSVADVCDLTGFSSKTVRRAIQDESLPAYKVRGQWRISVTAYEAWTGASRGNDDPERRLKSCDQVT